MDCPDAVLEEPGSRDGHSEEDGSVLRTVKLLSDLVSSFLHHPKDNSENGIETLGLLGGRDGRDNKFQVTHLLLPKQTGQDDSCYMEGIEDVLEIVNLDNIVILVTHHYHPLPPLSEVSVSQEPDVAETQGHSPTLFVKKNGAEVWNMAK